MPDDDGVVLTVTETGFASLDADAVDRRRRFEENSTGWEEELTVARERARELRELQEQDHDTTGRGR